MSVRYTDQQIQAFLQERKSLPEDSRSLLKTVSNRRHRERQLNITGGDGNEFQLILRKNDINPLDFSVILALRDPQSNRTFRLRRYNGKSHPHTNHIEGDSFYDFHVHTATERYQARGGDEEAYAERTDRYDNFDDAVRCLFDDAGFDRPPVLQDSLFKENGHDC